MVLVSSIFFIIYLINVLFVGFFTVVLIGVVSSSLLVDDEGKTQNSSWRARKQATTRW